MKLPLVAILHQGDFSPLLCGGGVTEKGAIVKRNLKYDELISCYEISFHNFIIGSIPLIVNTFLKKISN